MTWVRFWHYRPSVSESPVTDGFFPIYRAGNANLRCFVFCQPRKNGWTNSRWVGDLRHYQDHVASLSCAVLVREINFQSIATCFLNYVRLSVSRPRPLCVRVCVRACVLCVCANNTNRLVNTRNIGLEPKIYNTSAEHFWGTGVISLAPDYQYFGRICRYWQLVNELSVCRVWNTNGYSNITKRLVFSVVSGTHIDSGHALTRHTNAYSRYCMLNDKSLSNIFCNLDWLDDEFIMMA